MKALLAALLALGALALTVPAEAQTQNADLPPRAATFTWNDAQTELTSDFSFRDVLTTPIRAKLTRGLPARILLTGVLYAAATHAPIATTYQACKVTWHVWEEMYHVEVQRTNHASPETHWIPTVGGVERRCTQANGLLVANRLQFEPARAVYLRVRIVVNPVSDEMLEKLRHWITRPAEGLEVAPGGALLSTFTGLFMRRVEPSDQTLSFQTRASVPGVARASASP